MLPILFENESIRLGEVKCFANPSLMQGLLESISCRRGYANVLFLLGSSSVHYKSESVELSSSPFRPLIFF
jgi:hypothetical protein